MSIFDAARLSKWVGFPCLWVDGEVEMSFTWDDVLVDDPLPRTDLADFDF